MEKDINKEVVKFSWQGEDYEERIENYNLKNISIMEIKEALNKVSGKYTYWASKVAEVAKSFEGLQLAYDIWYAKTYLGVSKNNSKATEKMKNNVILVEQEEDVRSKLSQLHDITHVLGKLKAIVKGYEIQYKTLQSLSAIHRHEIEQLNSF